MQKDKKQMRQEMLKALNLVSNDQYETWSNHIFEQFVHTSFFMQAKTIGITLSHDREVNTIPIINHCFKRKKRVVVPKCKPKTKQMSFHEIQSFDDVEEGYCHLLEPKEMTTAIVPSDEIDLMVVPGVCFSLNGFRIGYGGGYYDRYLTHFCGLTVSLCFEKQLLNEVPYEKHDQPVQYIITEKNIYLCK